MTIASTNQSERQIASAKSKDKTGALRSKSRSPHRKNTPTSNSLTPQSGTSVQSNHKPPKSSPPPAGRSRVKSSRRPHTSAGPRDTSNLLFLQEFELQDRTTDPSDRVFRSAGQLSKISSTRLLLQDSHASVKTRTVVPHDGNSQVIFQPISLDHVRDWEEELARIEMRSRRSSADMLGLRKR